VAKRTKKVAAGGSGKKRKRKIAAGGNGKKRKRTKVA